MKTHTALYVGPDQVMNDWGVSRATAYNMIRKLNTQLEQAHPEAIIIAGKTNKFWYEKACLKTSKESS